MGVTVGDVSRRSEHRPRPVVGTNCQSRRRGNAALVSPLCTRGYVRVDLMMTHKRMLIMIPTRPRRLNGMRPYSHKRPPRGILNKMSETICLPVRAGTFVKTMPQLPMDEELPMPTDTLTETASPCLSGTRTFQVTSTTPLAGSVPLVPSVLPKNRDFATRVRSGLETMTGVSRYSVWVI
jgi:hypothetical protein